MIDASLPAYRHACHADAVDRLRVPVRLNGPGNGRVVIMLDEAQRRLDAYDIVATACMSPCSGR